MSQHRVSEHNSNDSEANTDSANPPQPDITRTIEEILLELWETPYPEQNMGLLPDEEDEKDTFRRNVNEAHEKDIDEAVHKLVTLVNEARNQPPKKVKE